MFKPTLAAAADLAKLCYPLYASPKLDGIRATLVDGKLVSRTLKPIPNNWIRSQLEFSSLEGHDGELIVGSPYAHDCYLASLSGVMRHEGEPNFTFSVFDKWDAPGTFAERYEWLQKAQPFKSRVQLLTQVLVHSEAELLAYETETVERGYEGLILRDPAAPYKFGRSTVNEGYLLKLKRFEDSEAEILEVLEEMHNANEAQTNELGRTKRSTAKAGLVGKGTMGALRVRDIHHGWEFNIGTGFTAAQRAEKWRVGSVHKYKYFPVGMKDVPRHPVYLGPRSKLDL